MRLSYLIIFFCFLNSSFSFSKVTVVTYNMAQLKKTFDLVACTKKRIDPQLDAMFFQENSAPARGENFVYLLQEVFNKNAFNKLQEVTSSLGLYLFPDNYEAVKKNGQVMVSNLKVNESKFTPFSQDSHGKKGILYSLFELPSGDKLGIVNVHTAYSNKKLSKIHKQQFLDLTKFVKENESKSDYFVIGGDFNAGPKLKYQDESFDDAKSLWEDEALPILEASGIQPVVNDEKTWDESGNPLIKKPAFLIKLYNFFTTGRSSWHSPMAMIDHIFTSKGITVLETNVVFDEKVKIACRGRSDREGKSTLSDHYGLETVLDIY